MPKYAILSLLLLCLSSPCALAQADAVIMNINAYLAEHLPEQQDLSVLTERLTFYQKHPIDLNQAKPEQLNELVFLSALQISNFFSHLKTNGPLKDLLELQAIDEFDLETVSRLLPFVIINPEKGYEQLSLPTLISKGEHQLVLRYVQTLEKKKGFKDLPGSRYLGSPQQLLFKYKFQLAKLASLSILADKDAGETFFSGNNKSGFDFLSASLAFYKNGRFKQIILGDFSVQLGQGLSLWTGSSFGKGPDVAGVAKKETGLKPYSSTSEFTFFRGIGVTFKLLPNIDLNTFISYRTLDASLSKDSMGRQTLSTIGMSGLHRTPTEISNQGKLGQLLYGTNIQYSSNGFDLGAVVYHSSYEQEFITGNQLYKRYAFQGKELTNLSIYYNYTYKNIYCFGEAAKSNPGMLAAIYGAMASLSPSISAVLVYRDYSRRHVSFYSQPLGEGSAAANEKGIYGGIHFSRGTKWSSSIYLDLFHFPWAKYRIDTASSGYDLMWQLNFIPYKTFKALLKLSRKKTEQNLRSGLPRNPVGPVHKSNYRLEVQWKASRSISLGNRIEINRYDKGSSFATYGFLVYQDAGYRPLSSKIAASIRLAFFHTSLYENRVYAYEDDVLNGSGSGLYNGSGMRTFLNLSYRLSKPLSLWLRYALSVYPGEETTGSGLDQINGNKQSQIKLQLRYQF